MRNRERWVITQILKKKRGSKSASGKSYANHPLFQNSYDGILLIDSGQKICNINPSFLALYGTPDPFMVIGKQFLDTISETYKETVLSMLELFELTRTPTQPVEVEICNYEHKPISVCVWITDTAQNIKEMTHIYVRDISEWKKAQSYLTQANLELGDAYRDTLEGWGRALELRDHETQGHTKRVTEGAIQLAMMLNISIEKIKIIRYGAMLHDIGKMAIPDSILLKPGPLDASEWQIMKLHPVYARDMLSEINFLKSAITIPYFHHEKWDGTGYPTGLKGEEIPVESRIFTIIDVWDALLSDRPYRKGWPREKVIQYIRENKGIYFDPKIADIFLKLQQ